MPRQRPPIGKGSPFLTALFDFAGLPPLFEIPNRAVVSGEGGFVFDGDYTSGSTTDISLTTGAARVDQRLIQAFGSGDGAEFVLAIDAVRLEVIGGTETELVLSDFGASVYLEHVGGTRTIAVPLHDCLGTWATATANTNNAIVAVKRPARWQELVEPLYINNNNDGFNLGFARAVTFAGGNPNVKVYLRGAAWQSDMYGHPPVEAAFGEGDELSGQRLRGLRWARRHLGQLAAFRGARGGGR